MRVREESSVLHPTFFKENTDEQRAKYEQDKERKTKLGKVKVHQSLYQILKIVFIKSR